VLVMQMLMLQMYRDSLSASSNFGPEKIRYLDYIFKTLEADVEKDGLARLVADHEYWLSKFDNQCLK
jgi:hypothetical protein